MAEEYENQMVEPERVARLGNDMDNAVADNVEATIPTGSYSVNGLNALVNALNKVLPLFQMPDYPTFDEEINGPLPEEFVRQLAMINEAATAANLEPMPFDEATDDTGLQMMAGRLDLLAKDKTFKVFLEEQVSMMDEDMPEEEEEMVEEIPMGNEIDDEQLFMERM
tara:strand:+ start:77 stop:577 length:501 start_codon:yes stop_codon:yes gene_type:complete